MSRKDDTSRRKVLLTTGSMGSAVVGLSSIAAGDTGDTSDTSNSSAEVTDEESKLNLDRSNVQLTSASPDNQPESSGQTPSFIDNPKIFIGQTKNAETPNGEPIAVESEEEYLDREAPPGFSPNDLQHSKFNTTAVTPASLPSSYIKKTKSVSFSGKTFEVGVGIGASLKTNFKSAGANLKVDLYFGGFSVTVSEFGIGYNISDKGICLSRIKGSYSIVDIEADICLNVTFTGDTLSIGVKANLCADPCKVIKCQACKGIGFSPDQFTFRF
ncbi:hypothetical protein HT576_05300 [Haloterrigena sp. SYSU A121-1]|uniref:Uncharacterized protein n=1 Tax=Haloterrigena gelatinilytica TaxID=2741724 RepID=A0A8J8GJN4_9EURY|nr:hypothetical protein [Haloterrigena gelatinilytica]NUB90450.1 hypothetical protein [Haloterrigena gelatinilytica]